MNIIKVIDIIGNNCISFDAGNTLLNIIFPLIKKKEIITIDFEGVNYFSSVFFNAAFGKLFASITLLDFLTYIKIINLDKNNINTLNLCIKNANRYYTDYAYRIIHDEVITNIAINGFD